MFAKRKGGSHGQSRGLHRGRHSSTIEELRRDSIMHIRRRSNPTKESSMKVSRWWAALAIAGVVALTAGWPGSPQHTLAGGKVTVVWSTVATGTTVMDDISAAFDAANPNITAKAVIQSGDSNTVRASLTNQFIAGSSTPDVYGSDQTWVAESVANHFNVDLTNLIPQQYLKSMSSTLVNGYKYKGRLEALPFFSDAGVLYYRKDLLTQAHLPVPTTWEQLVAEAKQLQKSKAVKYGFVYRGAPYEGTTVFWTELMADAGGSTVNTDYTKAVDDSAAGLRVMNFLKSTVSSGISPQAVSTFKEAQSENVFGAGNAAFLSSNAYMWPSISKSPVAHEVGVAVMPTFAGRPGPGFSGSGGNGMYINPNTKHLQEAIKLVEFLSSPKAQLILAKKLIPANVEVQKNPAVDSVDPPAGLQPILRMVNRQASTKNYTKLTRAIADNVNAVISGTESPSAALKAMQDQINAALQGGG